MLRQDKVIEITNLLRQVLKIAPNFSEAQRALNYLVQKVTEFQENIFSEVVSKFFAKENKEMLNELKQHIDKLKTQAKEFRLESEKYDVYRLFRE